MSRNIIYSLLFACLFGVIALFVKMGPTPTDKYEKNKVFIQQEIIQLLNDSNYDAAISLIKPYANYVDSVAEQIKDIKETQILEQLKLIPVEEYENNFSLYAKLQTLRPDNERYKNKTKFYLDKLTAIRKLEEEELAREKARQLEDRKNPPWSQSVSDDPMTKKRSLFFASPLYTSVKPMGFPYEDTQTQMNIGCTRGDMWSYMYFSNAPNLTNVDVKDGYNEALIRIRFDDSLQNIKIRQKWGAKYLHILDDYDFIERLQSSSSVRIELQWHSQGNVYFDYKLHRFSELFPNFKAKCDDL